MKLLLNVIVGIVTLTTLAASANAAMGQTVIAVPSVDLNRFAGSWYEIARISDKREKGCIADVVDLVALGDRRDHLSLVNSCKAKNDYTDVRNADIKAEKNSSGSKLKVTYLWPFGEKNWVLALGADYEWVLIGNPNHKDLKILSRTRTLSPETVTGIRTKAASQGYATEKLLMTLQTGR